MLMCRQQPDVAALLDFMYIGLRLPNECRAFCKKDLKHLGMQLTGFDLKLI